MKLIKFLPLLIIIAGCTSLSDKPTAAPELGDKANEQAVITKSANGTHEKTFENGMKVIVKEDHRAPVVISQVWYRVGSAQEHSGITGVSHVLEQYDVQRHREIPFRYFLFYCGRDWCA